MSEERPMTIDQFLTPAQIEQARKLFITASAGNFNKQVVAEIIEPNMAEIERKLGQECDARYLGYAIEHVFNQMGVK